MTEFYTREIKEKSDLREFIRLPWRIYRDDPGWVPPLMAEMRRKLNPQKNPFFEYGYVKCFGVFNDDREMVGRVAAIFNPVHCEVHRESAGFFGLFECINSIEAARKLIESVSEKLRSFQCGRMVGPVNFNTNDESGLLVEGYEESPMIMCNYARPYYADLLTACGGEKMMDMLSYGGKLGHSFPQKYMHVVERVFSNMAITVRSLDRHNMLQDIATIREIYNESFREVWGFVPLSPSEAEAMGRNFISLSDDELVWIAEYQKKPVGFILGLPDVNEILNDLNGRLFPFGIVKFLLKRHRLQGVRVVALGVLPAYRSIGIEALLVYKVHTRIISGGYQRAELSVVNENNMKMRQVLEGLGFRPVKRYRLYGFPILDSEDMGRSAEAAMRSDSRGGSP